MKNLSAAKNILNKNLLSSIRFFTIEGCHHPSRYQVANMMNQYQSEPSSFLIEFNQHRLVYHREW